jgi:hypothetical protein
MLRRRETPRHRATRVCSLAALLLACLLASPTPADAARAHHQAHRHAAHHAASAAPTVPSTLPATPVAPSDDGGDSQNVLTGIGGDPLSRNGLTSPACRDGRGLTATQAANCKVSGSPAAPEPIDHYQFDIHIDTPDVGVGVADVYLVIQNLIIQPLWMMALWLTHAVLIALAWCFHLDLFNQETLGPIARALNNGRRLFTDPWLRVALAAASIWLTFVGVIQRRVGDGISRLLLMVVMMTFGLWIINHPFGSIGWLANTVQRASLGTVTAFSTGSVRQADTNFNTSLQRIFENAIEKPYSYLEFGDVDWGTNPARRDSRLFAEDKIKDAVSANLSSVLSSVCGGDILHCDFNNLDAALKARMAPDLARARAARTNAELFLVFPANGNARNSINDEKSLFHTLCQPVDNNSCSGPTANQANFRKQGQTLPRLAGALLICAGLLGLVMLLVFLSYKLLTAALFALFYLLFAPVMVVIVAFGEGGQKQFKQWVVRLLGAVLAKLLFAVLLGVVFLLVDVLGSMGTLGWWTQWFLIGVFYWMVWLHREEVMSFMRFGHRDLGEYGRSAAGGLLAAAMAWRMGKGAARTAKSVVTAPARAGTSIGRRGIDEFRKRRSARELEDGERQRAAMHATADAASEDRADQVDRSLDAELAGHREQAAPLTALRHRAERYRTAADAAREAGDRGGAQRLDHARSTAEHRRAAMRRDRPLTARSDEIVEDAEAQIARTGSPFTEAQRRDRAAWLDRQTETPARAGTRDQIAAGEARDYARLAALARPNMTPAQYEALPAPGRARINEDIDAQLERRRAAAVLDGAGTPTPDKVRDYLRAHQGADPVPGVPSRLQPRWDAELRERRLARQFAAVDQALLDRERDRHRPSRPPAGRR